MAITLQLPNDVEINLTAAHGELPRWVLEAIAVEGYRQEVFSRGQVSEILGLSYWETEAFLKDHGAYLHYNEADLDQDREANQRILSIKQ